MMPLATQSIGAGPNIALIHGWGITSVALMPAANLLAERARVTLCDLPGYGANAHRHGDAESFDKITDLLDQSLPKDSFILGWSLGGLIALNLALKRGASCPGVITVCSSPRFTEEISELDHNEQIWNGVEPRLLRAFSWHLKPSNKDAVCDRFLSIQAMGSPSIRHDIRQLRLALQAGTKPSYEALKLGLKILAETDLREECMNMAAPSLHIFGKSDRLIPRETVSFWNKVPLAQTVVFEESSHNPFLSEKEKFVCSVMDFMASHA